MSTMVMAPPLHPRSFQRPPSPSKKNAGNGRAESAAATKQKLHAIMMSTKAKEEGEDDGYAADDDKGEGTSAAGAAAAASLAQTTTGAFAKHLDIAALLKEPLQFIPARLPDSSQRDIPYEPLPGPPVPGATANGQVNGKTSAPVRPNGKQVATGDEEESGETSATSSAVKAKASTADIPIPTSWPQAFGPGPGYGNLGNTCFLNSTLQALAHTAPLVGCLLSDSYHSSKTCRLAINRKFCLLCAMQTHIRICFNKNSARPSSIEPRQIVGNLRQIAKQMRVGRQEDAHEFLRFSLDGMQTSAAANMQPPAKTEAQKDATWMNKIFGGKLRSRVSCLSCKQDSDTYDNFMDLSLDVAKTASVKEALKSFVKIDQLSGSNKYKCEKCKKLVNARKQFTINQAPQILHIHLKRFTPTGKKISGSIQYPEQLRLREYMSDPESEDPQYRLYAIVSHSGSGPHSGHYYAHVRAGNQKWYGMNDSSVSTSSIQQALTQRNAYLLFYERVNRLGDVLNFSAPKATGQSQQSQTNGSLKRKERDEDDDEDTKSQGSPFPAQQIKRHQSNGAVGSGFKPPYALPSQQQHSSPSRPTNYFQHKKENEKRRHSLPGMKPNAFYSHNKHANRPKLVTAMKGRP